MPKAPFRNSNHGHVHTVGLLEIELPKPNLRIRFVELIELALLEEENDIVVLALHQEH